MESEQKDTALLKTDRLKQAIADPKLKLSEQTFLMLEHKVTIISGEAGMGKSTTLTSFAVQLKSQYPTAWVINLNLKACETNLSKHLEVVNDETFLAWMGEIYLKSPHTLEKNLFRYRVHHPSGPSHRIFLLLDGFDEIQDPANQQKIIQLLKFIQTTQISVYVTTRPYQKATLEEALSTPAMVLEPFDLNQQEDYLIRFWRTSLKLKFDSAALDALPYQVYANALLTKAQSVLNDVNIRFMGIPLQMRILAENFKQDFEKFCSELNALETLPTRFESVDLLSLYQCFIQKKFQIYVNEKETDRSSQRNFFKSCTSDHRFIALKLLFPNQDIKLIASNIHVPKTFEDFETLKETVNRIGLAQYLEEHIEFVHRSFAEYLVADAFVDFLKTNSQDQQVWSSLLKVILVEDRNYVIRRFLDLSLAKLKKQDLEQIQVPRSYVEDAQNIKSNQPLHHVAKEGLVATARFLLQPFQSESSQDHALKQLLLSKDKDGKTPLHVAAFAQRESMVEFLSNRAEYLDHRREILFAQDKQGKTALHFILEGTDREFRNSGPSVLASAEKTILKLKEAIKSDFYTFLTIRENYKSVYLINENTALHAWLSSLSSYRVGSDDPAGEIIPTLLAGLPKDKCKDYLLLQGSLLLGDLPEDRRKEYFPFPRSAMILTQSGRTFLHLAASLEVPGNFIHLIKQALKFTPDISEKILSATDDRGKTILHLATVPVLDYLLSEKRLTHLIKKLSFKQDHEGNVALHDAIYCSNARRTERLLKVLVNKSDIIRLLLLNNKEHLTPLHLASRISEGLFNILSQQINTSEDVNQIFTDQELEFGTTILHRAAFLSDYAIIAFAIEKGQIYPNVLRSALNKQDFYGKTALHYLLCRSMFNNEDFDVISDLLALFKNDQDALKRYLLIQNNGGFTALHYVKSTLYVGQENNVHAVVKAILMHVEDLADFRNRMHALNQAKEKQAGFQEGSFKLLHFPRASTNREAILMEIAKYIDHQYSSPVPADAQIQTQKVNQNLFKHLDRIWNIPGVKRITSKHPILQTEQQSINKKGQCIGITRIFSQLLFLDQHQAFLTNLKTAHDLGQIEQKSSQEIETLKQFHGTINLFQSTGSIAYSLPEDLHPFKARKTYRQLQNYLEMLTGDFAIHLVTRNHVVAIYRRDNTYAYFDTNAIYAAGVQTIPVLVNMVEQAIGQAGYSLQKDNHLFVEYFDVMQANTQLTPAQKRILTTPIQTERQRLQMQDQTLGTLTLNGHPITRVQLYDLGAQIKLQENDSAIRIHAAMKLNQEEFNQILQANRIALMPQNYVDIFRKVENKAQKDELLRIANDIPFTETEELDLAQKIRTQGYFSQDTPSNNFFLSSHPKLLTAASRITLLRGIQGTLTPCDSNNDRGSFLRCKP